MTINDIRQCIIKESYEFSFHAQQERLEDDLDITDIEAAIMNGAKCWKTIPMIHEGKAVCFWDTWEKILFISSQVGLG